jgi:hypothetical protein
MGHAAGRVLPERLAGNTDEQAPPPFPATLRVRESVAAPA